MGWHPCQGNMMDLYQLRGVATFNSTGLIRHSEGTWSRSISLSYQAESTPIIEELLKQRYTISWKFNLPK